MITRRQFSLKGIIQFSGGHLIWLTTFGTISVILYETLGFHFLSIPWLPISLIGTAVAFYVGFKNNSAFDRLWEARKIWGAIVNDSRSWGISINHYITEMFYGADCDIKKVESIKKKMIYRHIGWIYVLRDQLLQSTPWEHINASYLVRTINKRRMESFGKGLYPDEPEIADRLKKFLSKEETEHIYKAKNKATRLIDNQANDLKELRKELLIDDFRHMEMQKILNNFYTYQGQCERIKNYPLPRQYASISFIFIAIFIVLLPFGLMPEFQKLGDGFIWLTIPFTTLVGWVFVMMELVGDYSENPFEGLANDIPMLSLCRTIEIDLRQMLDEDDLPPKIEIVKGILM